MKHIFAVFISIIMPSAAVFGAVATVGGGTAYASEESSSDSDEVPRSFEEIEYEKVDRVDILRIFLERYNSPLADYAETFVEVADKYGMDYRIMPAISGVESTFAKQYIPRTHNPFGWGGGKIAFDSFDSAIEGLGKGLHDIYLSKGLNTVEKIGPVYCPPSYQSWISKVNYFKNQMPEI